MPAVSLTDAPLYQDVAEGPEGGAAYWVEASDGTRIRVALWPMDEARATVLMFPGRTEYIEKYGRLAQDMQRAGFALAAVDWRGQGLSDRPQHNRDMGHVVDFSEYRDDVAAMIEALQVLAPPRPWFLIAHSMGGAIGLRALHDGLPVERAVFSAPMWGVFLSPLMRPALSLVSHVAKALNFDHRYTPTTGPAEEMVFENNLLTSDPGQFDYMARQVETHPDLALGGPSIRWLAEALDETDALMRMPAPAYAALTFLGTRERIVDPPAIQKRMAKWPRGRLEIIDGAEHEILMEAPALRRPVLAEIIAWFEQDLAASTDADDAHAPRPR